MGSITYYCCCYNLFIASAWSGLSKGIQYLSNANIGLGTILMIVALIVGPTVLILNMFTSSIGSCSIHSYLTVLIQQH